jgi:hypothetical protein
LRPAAEHNAVDVYCSVTKLEREVGEFRIVEVRLEDVALARDHGLVVVGCHCLARFVVLVAEGCWVVRVRASCTVEDCGEIPSVHCSSKDTDINSLKFAPLILASLYPLRIQDTTQENSSASEDGFGSCHCKSEVLDYGAALRRHQITK